MGPIYSSYLYSSREKLSKIVHPLAHPARLFFFFKGGVAACTPTLPGHQRIFLRYLSHRALFPMALQAVLELVSIVDDPVRINKQIQGGASCVCGPGHQGLRYPARRVGGSRPGDPVPWDDRISWTESSNAACRIAKSLMAWPTNA